MIIIYILRNSQFALLFHFHGFSERLATDRIPEMVPEAGEENFRSRQVTRLRGTMASREVTTVQGELLQVEGDDKDVNVQHI